MSLNSEWALFCITTQNVVGFGANCVKLVEARVILWQTKNVSQTISFWQRQIYSDIHKYYRE